MTISYHRPFAVSTKQKPSPPTQGPGRGGKDGRRPSFWRRWPWWLWLLLPLLWLLLVTVVLIGAGWYLAQRPVAEDAAEKPAVTSVEKLKASNAALSRKLEALAPKGQYVVIDTASNRVYLREGETTLREMVASCGSGNVLEDPVGGRRWVFDTPQGDFKIQVKKTDPVWIKPDWAFIEEGEEIPKDGSGRAEPGMMGDYALGIGQGYYIHGTLYKRLLGRNVSHGCVRLGDEDLEYLYKTAPLGTRVIIF